MEMVTAAPMKTAQRRDQGVTALTHCQCITNTCMSVHLLTVPRIIENN